MTFQLQCEVKCEKGSTSYTGHKYTHAWSDLKSQSQTCIKPNASKAVLAVNAQMQLQQVAPKHSGLLRPNCHQNCKY